VRALVGIVAAAVAGLGCASTNPDPWEGMNRPVFGFNEGVDRWALEPVARGWDWLLPEFAETGLRNFFDNLGMPIVFVNDVLQVKPLAAGQDVARFGVNTTVGVVGLFDVASRIGLPENDEDFGQTLGRWGVPPGPYWVLPLLGPSSPRDAVGRVGDYAASLLWLLPFWARASINGVDTVNTRAHYLEEVAANRAEAIDYYVFVRDAWVKNRRSRVEDSTEASAEEQEDLYHVEEDEE
jgi:phospholipid-binding lipoprotein MlaA